MMQAYVMAATLLAAHPAAAMDKAKKPAEPVAGMYVQELNAAKIKLVVARNDFETLVIFDPKVKTGNIALYGQTCKQDPWAPLKGQASRGLTILDSSYDRATLIKYVNRFLECERRLEFIVTEDGVEAPAFGEPTKEESKKEIAGS